MKKKWTRRNFLRTSLGSPLAVSATLGGAKAARAAEKKSTAPASCLSADERTTLHAAMGEIIPAAGDMPSASAAGGVDYVIRVVQEDAALRRAVETSVASLEALSKKNHRKQFASLASEQRVETLRAYERQSPEEFAALRDLIYEAYYTEPRVWKLIGYELHPTNEAGPHVKPFDESVLAQVKKLPKRYREVT